MVLRLRTLNVEAGQELTTAFGHTGRISTIENILAVMTGGYQICIPQQGQVMRDGGLRQIKMRDNVAFVHLPLLQERKDALARLVRHRFCELVQITTRLPHSASALKARHTDSRWPGVGANTFELSTPLLDYGRADAFLLTLYAHVSYSICPIGHPAARTGHLLQSAHLINALGSQFRREISKGILHAGADGYDRVWLFLVQVFLLLQSPGPLSPLIRCYLAPDPYSENLLLLRATDQSPSPQTTTTGWLQISEAIFHVFVCHFTAVAECAGRKIEILQPFSEVAVATVIPYVQ